MAVVVQLVLLAVGFVLLVKGADWFVEGAGKLAEKFGIPQLVIFAGGGSQRVGGA